MVDKNKDPRAPTYDSRFEGSGYGGIGEGIDWDLSHFTPQSIANPTGLSSGNFAANSALGQTQPVQSAMYGGVSLPMLNIDTAANSIDFSSIPGSATASPATKSSFSAGASANTGGLFSDNYNDNRVNILDSNQQNLPYTQAQIAGAESPTIANEMTQANNMTNTTNQAGQFDYTGAINTGLSAFNTYNNYKLQNEKMDLYRTDLSMKWADQARRNNTRDAWSSAFKNA